MILALRALHAAGALEDRTIRVIFTGDEESLGDPVTEARQDMTELAARSDVALEFETAIAGPDHDFGTTARRGSSGWLLTVEGRTAHSSGIFSRGHGSRRRVRGRPDPRCVLRRAARGALPDVQPGGDRGRHRRGVRSPRMVRGSASSKTNIVAGRAVVHGGIRTISDDQLERARARMREIVARHLPRTTADIMFTDGYPGMPPTEGNRQLLRSTPPRAATWDTARSLEFDPGRRGASDLSFAAARVALGALGGLGVEGSGAHSPDETVDLESFARSAKRAALLIHRLR